MRVVEKSEFFKLDGKGYNIRVHSPDNFQNFKVDLVLEGENLAKAEALASELGLRIRTGLSYPTANGIKTEDVKYITFKYPNTGKFPRDSIPAYNTRTNAVITDLISHGADITVHFKAYPYSGGVNKEGFKYSAGNGFQLESIDVKNYTPFRRAG